MDTPHRLMISTNYPPKVLFLGNGILRLIDNNSWQDIIKKIGSSANIENNYGLLGIPLAMQPEAICGTNVEEIQRKISEVLKTKVHHSVVEELTGMDFDAILTTNYTYEIEDALLDGQWNEYKRKKSHTTLYGSPTVHHNTYKCNIVKRKDGKLIPVFHIHGERSRKKSLILSYYSYSEAVYHLIDMNKNRRNDYLEHQKSGRPLECMGWLDYYLLGEVYVVGFGFDLSEFDVWWATERKDRERANRGKLNVYITDRDSAKEKMLSSMNANIIMVEHDRGYDAAYEDIIKLIKESN